MEFLEEKKLICAIGKRVYNKGFVAANEGNLSTRVSEDRVLCTPTLHCKGFMTPDDICLVDMEGTQISGSRRRTSEVLLHLEIYRERPDVKSIVHCHPPHATAFGVAREPVPTCVLPEPDIFLGEVPIAAYETPGNQDFAETIRPFVKKTNTIILANHGTVSYEGTLERAYWLTEILDAYCRILILAKQLGSVHYVSAQKGQELLRLRKEWGFDDPRHSDPKAGQGLFDAFGETWAAAELAQRAFAPHPTGVADGANRELGTDWDWLIEKIADRVASKISGK